jgi:putative nucleotidyltransferase with HDIG domain
LEIPELPEDIRNILTKNDSPERLNRHLRIVAFTASNLLAETENIWNHLKLDIELVKFGAVTHDIGKAICQAEIYKPGKKHESLGKQLLIENGFSVESSRFAYTHGNWKGQNILLEDLFVTLADKIWKGKRVFELEERISQMISNQTKMNYWEVYQELDSMLDKIVLESQAKLNWQNEVK